MRDDNRTWEIVNQIRNNQVSSIGDILGTPRHAQVHSGHAQLVNLVKKFLLCIRHDNRTWDLEKWIRYNRVSSIRSSWVLISVIWCSFQPIFSIVNTMNFGKYIFLASPACKKSYFWTVELAKFFNWRPFWVPKWPPYLQSPDLRKYGHIKNPTILLWTSWFFYGS